MRRRMVRALGAPEEYKPSNSDAKNGKHQKTAQLVGDQAGDDSLLAVIGLDHRQAEEGGIAQTAGQHQRTHRGARQRQPFAHLPEKTCCQSKMDPCHGRDESHIPTQLEIMNIKQRQSRQRNMDDEAVERGWRVLRHTPEAPQQDAGDKAGDEKDDVVHGRIVYGTTGHSLRARAGRFYV